MKIKDLIEELQKLDPDGKMDICVDNIDIDYVSCNPSYWNGGQEILVQK